MKVSIIIPIYNVERYIRSCIDSCIRQLDVTLGLDYELILVNDGSLDRGPEIAREMTAHIEGVTFIDQKNNGLSVARNVGLDKAKGKYIWFVDSDDWIASDAVKRIIVKSNETEYDAIKLRAVRVFPDGTQLNRHGEFDETLITNGIDEGARSMSNTPAQFTVYRREFLEKNNLRFMKGIFHEDNEFTPRMYWFAEKIGFINAPLYYHRQNPNSICNTPNPKRAFDLLAVCESLSAFHDSYVNGNSSIYSLKLHQFISLSLNNAFDIISKQPSDIKGRFNAEVRMQKNLFRHLYRSRVIKYMAEGVLFSSLGHYDRLYDILRALKSN